LHCCGFFHCSSGNCKTSVKYIDIMASESGVAQVTAPAGDAKQQQQKSPKKVKKVSAAGRKAAGGAKKASADHPKYSEMVHQAVANLKERGGSSRQAILKYIVKNFNVGKDESVVNTHLKMALKSGVKNASLKQSKGSGASGSFRIGSEAKKPAKKVASKKKTSATKTPKAAKASPKKKKAAKSVQKKTGVAKKAAVKKSTAKKVAPSAVKKTKVSAVKKTPTVKKPKTAASTKKPAVRKA
jgi:histone H1/5